MKALDNATPPVRMGRIIITPCFEFPISNDPYDLTHNRITVKFIVSLDRDDMFNGVCTYSNFPKNSESSVIAVKR